MTNSEPLVDAHAVAAYLGVSYQTALRWAGQRTIPSVKLGALVRFRMSEIEDWVRENSREARAS